MTTKERIQHLTQSGQSPEFLGEFSAHNLTDWISAELGHAEALDTFTPHGPLMSRAIAPHSILHIVSGNTPHAAIQSVLRGILLGSHNIIKLPSTGLPELINWIQQLPQELQDGVEIHTQLTEDHWQQAQAVIAIGSDQTMASIQQKIRAGQTFIPHGHKISIGIVTDHFDQAAPLAAQDVSLYNQRGCLSPHAIYVKETQKGDTLAFGKKLADAMENFSQHSPPSPISLSEAGAIRNLRETTRFAAANSKDHAIWESPNNLDWTVIYESSPKLRLSCLNRCIYVKPLPAPMNLQSFGEEAQHLSTIAIHPFHPEEAELLSRGLPAHRICPLGKSQEPTLFWHHDGFAPLASLIRWKDIG